jgi:hypothetical protein
VGVARHAIGARLDRAVMAAEEIRQLLEVAHGFVGGKHIAVARRESARELTEEPCPFLVTIRLEQRFR